MSKPANEPAVDRPPVTADVAPPGAVTELETVPETKIGRFKLPTESLRAYSMLLALVVIWLFFQWMTRDAHNPYGLFLNPINFSKLLQQMGVTGVLPILDAEEASPSSWTALTKEPEDKQRFQRNVIEAHEELAALPGAAGEPFRAAG